ncbi:hypothetical protein IG193_08610 [Infirmifilum lucidum]|uniref:Uncharacterized protein n=1 Tax=Infirmifilum lucidum TaxID=2776706 RepID=A0A7L9FIP5_9CREN|nr:hypothetical protein [Infirmifilum lucidum]QOJ78794.1 hypothetical protein IG193_08610 [Infirmifilum lucidum]
MEGELRVLASVALRELLQECRYGGRIVVPVVFKANKYVTPVTLARYATKALYNMVLGTEAAIGMDYVLYFSEV